MKKIKLISFIMSLMSATVFLSCTDKSDPIVAPEGGQEDLKFIVSSNVLDATKDEIRFDFDEPITFTLTEEILEANVIMLANGSIPIEVEVSIDESGTLVTVTSATGSWPSSYYSLEFNGILADEFSTPVNFTLYLYEDINLQPVASNFYNFESDRMYEDVDSEIDTLEVTFNETISKIEDLNMSNISLNSSISENTVSINLDIDKLASNTQYTVSFIAYADDGQSYSFSKSFQTAGNNFYAVASNVEVLYSSVGEKTTGFSADGSLWVVMSEAIDADVALLTWSNSGSTYDLYGEGYTASSINASVRISEDTLMVTPNPQAMTNITNGQTVGFRVTLVAAETELSTTIELQAELASDDMYIISSNVLGDDGLYRPFKVIGDSLVVTFSKAINPDEDAKVPFKVNGFSSDLSISWNTDFTIVTIKNNDSLTAAPYGAGSTPYRDGGSTEIYNNINFDFTAVDGETKAGLSGSPNIDIHTEYGMFAVYSNILDQLQSNLDVIGSSEATSDSVETDAVITVEFNLPIDTAKVNAASENTHFYLEAANGTFDGQIVPVMLSYSSDLKTVTLTPYKDFEERDTYFVVVKNVPGVGVSDAPKGRYSGSGINGGSLNSGSLLSSNEFTVKYIPIDISGQSVMIMQDTISAYDYSITSAGFDYNDNSLGTISTNDDPDPVTESDMRLYIKKYAWNENHNDSIDTYQYRVRTVSALGDTSGWYFAASTKAATTYAKTAFNESDETDTLIMWKINLTSESFISLLRVADNDGSALDYTNGDNIFNAGQKLQIQVRAIHDDDGAKDSDGDGDIYDAGEYTAWSNTLTWEDKIAPCDVDYVEADEMGNANYGGVSLAISGVSLDRTSAISTYDYKIFLTFPEDMDITTTPTISSWENEPATNSLPIPTGRWTSGRIYEFTYSLVNGVDYTEDVATNTSGLVDPYFAVSVVDMKDASGNIIAAHGDVGSAADGTDEVDADNTENQGSNNVARLIQF